VKFIADGDDSKYVRETLRDLEAQARADNFAVDELKRTLKAPVKLPTPDALLERSRDFEKVLAGEPVRAREALRGVLKDGRIEVCPGANGSYLAKATFLPMVAVAVSDHATRDADKPVAVPLLITIPKPPDRRRKIRHT
jgi:hypothetical protein